jgi:putative redox protein
MHAPSDAVVDIGEAQDLFKAARHPKSFISLDDADHLLTRPADAQYAADLIGAWASRFLPMRAERNDAPSDLRAGEGGGARSRLLAIDASRSAPPRRR